MGALLWRHCASATQPLSTYISGWGSLSTHPSWDGGRRTPKCITGPPSPVLQLRLQKEPHFWFWDGIRPRSLHPPQQSPTGCLVLHMVMYMFQCYSLNSSHTLLPLMRAHICSLCHHDSLSFIYYVLIVYDVFLHCLNFLSADIYSFSLCALNCLLPL